MQTTGSCGLCEDVPSSGETVVSSRVGAVLWAGLCSSCDCGWGVWGLGFCSQPETLWNMIRTPWGSQTGLGLTGQGLLLKADRGWIARVGAGHQEAEPGWFLKLGSTGQGQVKFGVQQRRGHEAPDQNVREGLPRANLNQDAPNATIQRSPLLPPRGGKRSRFGAGITGTCRWWGGEGLGQTLGNMIMWPRLSTSGRAQDPISRGRLTQQGRAGGEWGGRAAGLCLF